MGRALTRVHLEVQTVAVVCIAAVVVEQPLGAQAEEGLPRRNQLLFIDTDSNVLLLAINKGGGSHASPRRLTAVAILLTLRRGAVTQQTWRENGRDMDL